jgi:hypothetical protein
MQSQMKKTLFVAVLLSAIGVAAFVRDSRVGVRLSVLMQQPINNAALSRVADQSLQRIEAAQAVTKDGKQNKLDQLSLNALEIEVTSLSVQEAPAAEKKSYRDLRFDVKQPAMLDNYEPGIALEILEQETGLKRTELEAFLAEGR